MKPFQLTTAYRAGRLGTIACLLLAAFQMAARAQAYQETDLVSNLPGRAALTDPHLVNPWGISFAPGRPFWISDNGTGLSTLYGGDGSIIPSPVVVIPPQPGAPAGSVAAPTGQVFSGSSGVTLPTGAASVFTFAGEDGTLTGWNPALGNTAVLAVDNSAKGLGSVYKGLEIAATASGTRLYAADFRNGAVDVFNAQFQAVNPGPSGFVDPTLPAGYAPFNIVRMGSSLLVSYALQGADKEDDQRGAGHGYVDIFSTEGTLQKRLISGGVLNSPWGMAVAPAGFGAYSGDLLVGNFGDGRINAFDPETGLYKGTLKDSQGLPIAIDGLWGLAFRPDLAGQQGKLYFTAGLNDEADGLLGFIAAVPEPGTLWLSLTGLLTLAWMKRRR